jgi:hypothetical protein
MTASLIERLRKKIEELEQKTQLMHTGLQPLGGEEREIIVFDAMEKRVDITFGAYDPVDRQLKILNFNRFGFGSELLSMVLNTITQGKDVKMHVKVVGSRIFGILDAEEASLIEKEPNLVRAAVIYQNNTSGSSLRMKDESGEEYIVNDRSYKGALLITYFDGRARMNIGYIGIPVITPIGMKLIRFITWIPIEDQVDMQAEPVTEKTYQGNIGGSSKNNDDEQGWVELG